jgi:hypothetical protein
MIFAWSGLGLGGLLLQACDYLHERYFFRLVFRLPSRGLGQLLEHSG